MSRIARFVVLVTALTSLFAVMSSTAGAVTWHNTGNTAYTATGGAGTLSTPNGQINCQGVDVTGTSPAVTTTNDLATLTARFTNCFALFVPATVHCRITLTGNAQDATGTVTGTGDVHCGVVISGLGQSCTVTGTVAGSYTAPGANPGTLHVPHSTGLTVAAAAGGSCGVGGAGTLTAQTWRVTNGTGGTGTTGPRFTRTA